jgi:HSP20 family protein
MTQNVVANKEEAQTDVTAPERIHGGVSYTPRVDILETENELLIFADVPGCKPEDVDIRYENGHLEIFGKCQSRQPENVEYLLNEYGVGDYYRAFTISEAFDAFKIEAALKQGVLKLRLPKSEAVKPKKIQVKSE